MGEGPGTFSSTWSSSSYKTVANGDRGGDVNAEKQGVGMEAEDDGTIWSPGSYQAEGV